MVDALLGHLASGSVALSVILDRQALLPQNQRNSCLCGDSPSHSCWLRWHWCPCPRRPRRWVSRTSVPAWSASDERCSRERASRNSRCTSSASSKTSSAHIEI